MPVRRPSPRGLSEGPIRKLWARSRENVVAIAAVLAAIAAIAGLVIAYEQLHNQNASQAEEKAKKHAAEIRTQAEAISGAVVAGPNGAEAEEDPHGGGFTAIALYNHSSTPVYDVIVSLVFVRGAGPHFGRELGGHGSAFQRYVSTLPPGGSEVRVSAGWAGMMAVPGVELGFTDQRGQNWLRYPNGKLLALTEPPASYYKLERPVGWAAARPLP
jgi:hypothetical protein